MDRFQNGCSRSVLRGPISIPNYHRHFLNNFANSCAPLVANFQNFLKHPLTFAFDTDKNNNKQRGWNMYCWTGHPVTRRTHTRRRGIGVLKAFFSLGGVNNFFLPKLNPVLPKNILSGGAKFSNFVFPSWCTILLCHTVLPVLTLGYNCWMMTQKEAIMEKIGKYMAETKKMAENWQTRQKNW